EIAHRTGPDRGLQIHRLLHRRPMRRSRVPVPADAVLHLRVLRGGGGDEPHRPAGFPAKAVGEARLAAPGSAEDQHEPHQKSMPRIARMPRSNACFCLRISVTVSATAMSCGGASRPVAITFTESGRPATTALTSSAGIQPQFIA